ncbi:alpha,alpha-trehalase [Flavobacteriaceae bacterium MAR_2010_188]|nr:alpha,alpha-trehalase [Flavobacteriaceae bacterium MAR_2010_188]
MKSVSYIIICFSLFFASFSCKQEEKQTQEISKNSELKMDIDKTLSRLLKQEDTDGDKKITVDDTAPKSFIIETADGNTYEVKGTAKLSNLLQELIRADDEGKEFAKLKITQIEEPPANRVSRSIKDFYWDGLTRHLDEEGINNLISDTKNKTLVSDQLRIYVSNKDTEAFDYYKSLEDKFPITVIKLPAQVTPEYVKSLNDKPGILALKLVKTDSSYQGVPFVVPGGRFNEMYGWDSYFESIGLLVDGRVDLAKAMAENFQYEIENYGKILNANRTYYLTRSQPPYFSSLIREVYEVTQDSAWLRDLMTTAIKEYETVWMKDGGRLTPTGLNRYFSDGIGVPPETEEGHFDVIIKPYAENAKLSMKDYVKKYQSGEIVNKELDEYFVHDRSMRESGHDTSYRIEGFTSDLNLVDLNGLLYKYETDFAELTESVFNGNFKTDKKSYTTDYWKEKALKRKQLSDALLWNEEKGMYFDFDFEKKQQSEFVAATTFVPMWSGMASKEQAKKLVENALPLLKEKGGIAGSTEDSRGPINEERPARQWDYPNGWAPHQIMIWKGLKDYGYDREAEELIYRWLYMITKNAAEFNGTIPEKYDVVEATHKVFAEYGNVGTDFQYITREGFGWMNASFQYGMSLLSPELKANLNSLTDPEELFSKQDTNQSKID